MKGHKIILLVLGVLLFAISCSSGAMEESVSPYSTLTPEIINNLIDSAQANLSVEGNRMNCQLSTTKGRRRYQEDRILCNLHILIPFHGYFRTQIVNVGVVAVFDGHIGEEASDMASKIFESEFLLNTYRVNHQSEIGYGYFVPWSGSESTLRSVEEIKYKEILKEALLKTIKNIDIEITKATIFSDQNLPSKFIQEAVKKNLASGTTAVIALLVDNQILVANVGDSKALLCSKDAQSSQNGGSLHLSSIELTRDHNALISEERARIEAAGGFIIDWDVPLVMGHFPMTRAIGDVPLKRYGIIAEPEVTGWQPLSANDSYLIVASDGIFESLSPKDVCNLLEGDRDKSSINHLPSQHESTADFIVQTAYVKGSSDNLSVVVVPLSSSRSSIESIQEESIRRFRVRGWWRWLDLEGGYWQRRFEASIGDSGQQACCGGDGGGGVSFVDGGFVLLGVGEEVRTNETTLFCVLEYPALYSDYDVDEALMRVFQSTIVAKNLKIRIPTLVEPQRILWTPSKNGKFSVSSSYFFKHFDPFSANSRGVASFWKRLWKVLLHERFKFFFWRLLVKAIPTRSHLNCIIPQINPLCLHCHEDLETEEHIFFILSICTKFVVEISLGFSNGGVL
ncbi:hypothetical protein BUALT_Bualt09G0031200 [Buddleja alternifolia]|uniref:PPM-type phosphatase domain-containing protein n=1 Tax=Buddleja alternifolia TaxID=168488 RepID=A0AAV6X7N9_9LAMI|nr:hypothetical protein BUALT_Bualt09G0031200 [Buddleja alternifolia]